MYRPSKLYALHQLLETHGDICLEELIKKIQGDRVHQCPECEGEGTVEELEELDSNDGKMGYFYTVKCPVCKGYGYTKNEKKPKMQQIGWG